MEHPPGSSLSFHRNARNPTQPIDAEERFGTVVREPAWATTRVVSMVVGTWAVERTVADTAAMVIDGTAEGIAEGTVNHTATEASGKASVVH